MNEKERVIPGVAPTDTERLDWMERHYAAFVCAHSHGVPPRGWDTDTTIRWTSMAIPHWPHDRHTTALLGFFRDAIDLAMQQSAREETTPDDPFWMDLIPGRMKVAPTTHGEPAVPAPCVVGRRTV